MNSLNQNFKPIRETEVKNGKIVLDVPKLDSGTTVKVKILSTDNNEIETTNQNENNSTGNSFEELHLLGEIIEAIEDAGYTTPTPIQKDAIPVILNNIDVLGTAQTGSGKTAAFVLPMLQKLHQSIPENKRYPRALILTPTRELAIQVANSVKAYGKFLTLYDVMIYGGVSQRPQVKKLHKGVDIIVATPGRLIDLINQGHIKLQGIEMFILDEADRMLDMGFLPDIKKVIKKMPRERQNLLFSATMPDGISKLARDIQKNPVRISVDSTSSTVENINEFVYHVGKSKKYDLLTHLFDTKPEMEKVLIFRRTKYSCDKLMKKLEKDGFFVDRIHGDRSQNQRERVLNKFRDEEIDILVGTDVAARGLDVDDITHVINYEVTNEPEVYLHRVGRTARAGKQGVVFNFVSNSEKKFLKEIERMTDEKMTIVEDFPGSNKSGNSGKSKKSKRKSIKSNKHDKNHKNNKSKRSNKKQYNRR